MENTKKSLQGKSVLITGGAGFIGSHLTDRVISENPSQVIVVDNFFLGSELNLISAAKRFPNIEIKRADASNFQSMMQLVRKHQVEVVFDLATIPLPTSLEFPSWTLSTNIEMATTFCELSRLNMIEELVHLSTSETYGSASYVPMPETHPRNPSTPYAASKISADAIIESYIHTFNIAATIIRPFNNFGPRQNAGSYAGIIPIVINKVMNNLPIEIFGDGKQTRDFSFVKQTVDTIVEIYLHKGSIRNTFNLASGSETAILDLVQKLLLILDSPNHEIVFCPKRPGDVYRHCGDVSKISELLGREMKTSLKLEDLSETVDWYRNIHGK
jgi:UDP-glucose 4-epimerase